MKFATGSYGAKSPIPPRPEVGIQNYIDFGPKIKMLKGNLVLDIDSKIQIMALFVTLEIGGLPYLLEICSQQLSEISLGF